jgi:hypothetical protein
MEAIDGHQEKTGMQLGIVIQLYAHDSNDLPASHCHSMSRITILIAKAESMSCPPQYLACLDARESKTWLPQSPEKVQ